MTEEQLRDVLARVVPEAPDSVADPVPVVRAARRRRRAVNAVVAGAAVLALTGGVLGLQTLRMDEGPDVVEPAPVPDPYSTAPCPAADQPRALDTVPGLDALTAVRYCTRPSEGGFETLVGPADALVVDLDAFTEAVRAIPDADPARCAAISVVPVANQILLELADGSQLSVATGKCDDVELEGRVVDGFSLEQALLTALRDQRDAHDYSVSLPAPDADWCGAYGALSPAEPSSEHLVAATFCGPDSPTEGGTVLDGAVVARLDVAWRSAREPDVEADMQCDELGGSGLQILARTDRGDLVELSDRGCGQLSFSPSTGNTGLGVSFGTFALDFEIDDLAEDG